MDERMAAAALGKLIELVFEKPGKKKLQNVTRLILSAAGPSLDFHKVSH